jgi:hypothetical protein
VDLQLCLLCIQLVCLSIAKRLGLHTDRTGRSREQQNNGSSATLCFQPTSHCLNVLQVT